MIRRIFVAFWFLLCLGVLIAGVASPETGRGADLVHVLYLLMLLLTFPSGMLVGGMVGMALMFWERYLDALVGPMPSWLALPVIWIGLTGAGYVQWFILLPKAWKLMLIRLRRPSTSTMSIKHTPR